MPLAGPNGDRGREDPDDDTSTDTTENTQDSPSSTQETTDATDAPALGGNTGDPRSGNNFTDGADDPAGNDNSQSSGEPGDTEDVGGPPTFGGGVADPEPSDPRDTEASMDTGGNGGSSGIEQPARGGNTGDAATGPGSNDNAGGGAGGSTGEPAANDNDVGGPPTFSGGVADPGDTTDSGGDPTDTDAGTDTGGNGGIEQPARGGNTGNASTGPGAGDTTGSATGSDSTPASPETNRERSTRGLGDENTNSGDDSSNRNTGSGSGSGQNETPETFGADVPEGTDGTGPGTPTSTPSGTNTQTPSTGEDSSTTRSSGTNAVNTAASGSEDLLNLVTEGVVDPTAQATGSVVDFIDPSKKSGASRFAENVVKSGGTTAASLSVGLPFVAQQTGETLFNAGKFTANNPGEAPGAAFDTAVDFTQETVSTARNEPGQLVGEFLVGLGAGKAATKVLPKSVTEGTTGTILRKTDPELQATRGAKKLNELVQRADPIPDSDTRGSLQVGKSRRRGDGGNDESVTSDRDSSGGEDLGPDMDPFDVSDTRLYDQSRTFGDSESVTSDTSQSVRTGESTEDIGSGVSGRGDPQPAAGVDLPDGGFSERGFGTTSRSTTGAARSVGAGSQTGVTSVVTPGVSGNANQRRELAEQFEVFGDDTVSDGESSAAGDLSGGDSVFDGLTGGRSSVSDSSISGISEVFEQESGRTTVSDTGISGLGDDVFSFSGSDTTPGTTSEPGTNTGTDTDPDVGAPTDTDTTVDSGAEATPEQTSEPVLDPDPTPEPTPEPTPDSTPDPTARFDRSPDNDVRVRPELEDDDDSESRGMLDSVSSFSEDSFDTGIADVEELVERFE
jgi:hypothetical protein